MQSNPKKSKTLHSDDEEVEKEVDDKEIDEDDDNGFDLGAKRVKNVAKGKASRSSQMMIAEHDNSHHISIREN